jgi:hypothetical protein
MPYPSSAIKPGRKPPRPGADPHGIPPSGAEQFRQLLALARNMRDACRTRREVVRDLLAVNRDLDAPLPTFSPGGLIDALGEIIGEPPPPRRASADRLTIHLTPLCPRCGRLAIRPRRLSLRLVTLCPGCGRVAPGVSHV